MLHLFLSSQTAATCFLRASMMEPQDNEVYLLKERQATAHYLLQLADAEADAERRLWLLNAAAVLFQQAWWVLPDTNTSTFAKHKRTHSKCTLPSAFAIHTFSCLSWTQSPQLIVPLFAFTFIHRWPKRHTQLFHNFCLFFAASGGRPRSALLRVAPRR